MKRCFDLFFSMIGIIFFSPIFLIVGLSITFCDPGPILFCQRRIGWQGKPFVLYKFRTMRVVDHATSGTFDPGDTSRVSRVGAFLRQTKLDEIPQLVNVLKGEMSLVGPRPEVEKWVRTYPRRWARVHTIRPGITDPASVRFRNEEEILARSDDPEMMYKKIILPQKLDLYEDYLKNQSVLGDIGIIFQTLYAVVGR